MTKKNETKKSLFGQMTLLGLMALNWLKSEGKTTQIKRILMGDAEAFKSQYDMPPFAKGIIAILHDVDKFVTPLFVNQQSVLRWMETMSIEWDGMCAEAVQRDGYLELIIDDGKEPIVNMKKSGPKQHDEYVCQIILPKIPKKKS